jgi:FdhD protein
MLQKAARMGIPVVVSFTAPTSLAVHLADHWGITLIGYAHGEHFKIYAHPERIETR